MSNLPRHEGKHKKKENKIMRVLVAIGVVCLLAGVADAGTWTVVDDNDLATGLDTSFGTLFKASNLGNGANAVTVGGIAYDTATGNVTGNASGTFAAYGGSDPDMANLLNTSMKVSQWGSGSDITLSGLTPGLDYKVQLVLLGPWAGCSANLYADGADPNYKYVYFGNSTIEKVATYTFTATDGDVVMNNWRNQGDYYVSAYAVHVIPEPATMSLLGVAGIGMIVARRKARG